MKGEILYKILNRLGDEAVDYWDFTNAFLKAGYGATGGKIQHEFSKLRNKRIRSQLNKQKINKFKKYLSKLKNDGLILADGSKKIYLSEKGKMKLDYFRKSFSLNKELYEKRIGKSVTVISYDIPIAFNRERNILRNLLRMLGFNLIHKSVWVGKAILPEGFVAHLNQLGIIDYVEILEVTKNGTLREKS